MKIVRERTARGGRRTWNSAFLRRRRPITEGSAHVASSVAASAAVSRCSAANASSLSSFCFSSEDLAFTLNVLTARTPAPVRATGSSTLPSSSTSSPASLSKSARAPPSSPSPAPRAARRRRARRTPAALARSATQRAANGVRRRGRRVGRGLFRLLELLELLRQRLLLREHGFRLGQSGGVRLGRQPPRRVPAAAAAGGAGGGGGVPPGGRPSPIAGVWTGAPPRGATPRRPSAASPPSPPSTISSARPRNAAFRRARSRADAGRPGVSGHESPRPSRAIAVASAARADSTHATPFSAAHPKCALEARWERPTHSSARLQNFFSRRLVSFDSASRHASHRKSV